MLNIIIRAFLKELSNLNIRREITRGLAFINKSLYKIYILTKESRLTKLEVSKLVIKDFKL